MANAELFASVAKTPAALALRQRLESGGALSCNAVSVSAQPFFAALLRHLFPTRPLVVVTDGLKSQESVHQDVSTWTQFLESDTGNRNEAIPAPHVSPLICRPLFYPAWETLPHESKLPHADVISERLETLVALSAWANSTRETPNAAPPILVTSVTALLQRTFRPGDIAARTRTLRKGDRMDALDLVEWLEEQGYEPEVQVNHKGEIALRGGIVDVFPLISPWPVRLEFFGDELESLRWFDPITQMSKENIESVTVPPRGELGILKRLVEKRSAASRTPPEQSAKSDE